MPNRTRFHLALFVVALALALAACGDGAPTSTGAQSLPEDALTYAVSHILIQNNDANPAAATSRVAEVLAELSKGTSFGDVARRMSQKEETAARDGWLGFVRSKERTPFTGAVQALPPGMISGPVQTDDDTQFVWRHPFHEAREIERQLVIPAYGCFFPWDTKGTGGPARAQAESRAREALEAVKSGEVSLEAAAKRYSMVPSPRTDLFIANAGDGGRHAGLYRSLAEVEPGAVALAEIEGAYVVARRGTYFRSQVRHILIQHLESKDRPLAVTRSRTDAKALAEDLLSKVSADPSLWDATVRRHNDDAMATPMNGWIGAITNGELPPELEAVLVATEPGQIAAEVVESEAGYHIVYRMN